MPENAQYYAAFGAVHVRPARGGRGRPSTRASTGSTSSSPAGARRASARPPGPPLVAQRATSSTRSASSTRSRSSSRRRSSPGQTVRAVIGLDGGSTSSQGRPRRRAEATSSRRRTSSPRATRSRTRRSSWRGCATASTDQGATLEVLGFGATGYAADVLEESRQVRREHRRDRRAHDVGDALLRRRRRHLRHRRAGHQGPVHEERRHQELPPLEPVLGRQRHAAAGDGRSVRRARSPTTPTTAFEAELSPKFSYGCAVFLDTDRVNFQKEGYSQGRAARRPRAGAAEERLAVRRADPAPGRAGHASSSSRAARSTTWPPSRRRSTTSRSASRAPRSSSTRTRGEAGAIGAAIETLRVVKRTRQLDLHRHRRGDRPRVHGEERRERRAVTSARTTARARSSTPSTPDGRHAPATSAGFSCEKGTVESKEAMLALVAERKKLVKQFPNLVDYEAKLLFRHFYDPAPMPEDGRADRGRRGHEAPCWASGASRSSAPFQRSVDRGAGAAPPACASASRACSTSTRRRRSCAPTSRRSASRSRTSSSPTRRPRRCGSRAASTARSIPASRRRSAQAHIHNLLFHHHSDGEAAQLHLLPDPHARADVREGRDGQRVAARSSPARPT